jgi:hypothetical protein
MHPMLSSRLVGLSEINNVQIVQRLIRGKLTVLLID